MLASSKRKINKEALGPFTGPRLLTLKHNRIFLAVDIFRIFKIYRSSTRGLFFEKKIRSRCEFHFNSHVCFYQFNLHPNFAKCHWSSQKRSKFLCQNLPPPEKLSFSAQFWSNNKQNYRNWSEEVTAYNPKESEKKWCQQDHAPCLIPSAKCHEFIDILWRYARDDI